MEELIKTNFLSYLGITIFTGFCLFRAIYAIFKKTKNTENKTVKRLLRIGVNGVLVCFWMWFFIYVNLFPISLAYYEYNQDIAKEKTGIIKSIEQDGKDRIYLIIDDTEYTIVDSSVDPAFDSGKDIKEGDTVSFKYGVNSKFIFDIYELD